MTWGCIPQPTVRSANWHITERCNYHCRFCFATHMGMELRDLKRQERVLDALVRAGIQKLNFVGGEPLLHPDLPNLVHRAKERGFVTSIQTNASLLTEKILEEIADDISWIGISVDSADESTERQLGRGNGNHVALAKDACACVKTLGLKLKVNTTVTTLNKNEDMRSFIEEISPDRWKVFQMLLVREQNDAAADLVPSDHEYSRFVDVNSGVKLAPRSTVVFERGEDMLASYLIIGPQGDFISNQNRILEHHVLDSLDEITLKGLIDQKKYTSRGGHYAW